MGADGEVDLTNSDEDSRDSNPPFREIQYRYSCSFVERSQPLYRLGPSVGCPAEKSER
jgi:hypothetical protein